MSVPSGNCNPSTLLGPVARKYRFRRDNPCPVCGGCDSDRRGRGLRCNGFLSEDGRFAHCSREEHAGNLPRNERSDTYAHRLGGDCDCGKGHEHDAAPDSGNGAPRETGRQTFAIRDASGHLVAEHVRRDFSDGGKDYSWRRDGKPGLDGLAVAALPLYGVEGLAKAPKDAAVVVVEGEKARDALAVRGVLAVGTVTGASGTPLGESLAPLVGHSVVLWPDNDDSGRAHMARIAASLTKLGQAPRWYTWPDAPPKGDAADYEGETDALHASLGRAVPWKSAEPGETDARNLSRWLPIPLSALGTDGVQVDWKWHGFLSAGALTLLVGFWKAGKTTLLKHLLVALNPDAPHADFMGQRVQPGNVVVITEESRALWAQRREELRLGDHVRLVSRPFLGRPSRKDWAAFLREQAEYVRAERVAVVIFDSLSTLWPVGDENDASEVQAALAPLQELTEAGAAVLLVHHPRKGEAGDGGAARGSGALPATADILMELRLYDTARPLEDRRRILTAVGRYEETTPELIVELTPGTGGYRLIGSKADATAGDRLGVVKSLLADGGRLTVEELRAKWPEGERAAVPKPGLRALETEMAAAYARGELHREGDGKKGAPFRYFVAVEDGGVGSALDSRNDSIPARPSYKGMTLRESNSLNKDGHFSPPQPNSRSEGLRESELPHEAPRMAKAIPARSHPYKEALREMSLLPVPTATVPASEPTRRAAMKRRSPAGPIEPAIEIVNGKEVIEV